MKLTKGAINNYQFSIIVFVILTIAGLSSYFSMPRTENPEMQVPGATIFVIYPGTSPVDMEELVAIPIEEAINELEDIKRIETGVSDGLVHIEVEFSFGTDAKDKYDEVVQQVNNIKAEKEISTKEHELLKRLKSTRREL